MTEQQAIKIIKEEKSWESDDRKIDAFIMAIDALEEIKQYRAIGTPDECRAAVEKQKAKKPTLIDYKKYMDVVENAKFLRGAYWCPNCNHVVKSGGFCNDCGQKLDWSDEE